ncbi:MAG: hypothetical protein KUG77_28300 [Nannocystaceae bacterium]|nr:hypothetical protein [Nannocystaceae bacterium]
MKPSRQFEVVDRLPGRLRLSGPGGEVEVDGVVLEAQLQLGSGESVLWSTDDCPFEEVLHITLVSPTGKVLDAVDLGQAMQPGLFQDLKALGDRTAEFGFFPQQRHRIEVFDAPCGLLDHIFRRRRLRLALTDQATTHDEPT